MSSHVEGSIGVMLSTICFLHCALVRQRTYEKEVVHLGCSRGRYI